MPPQRRQSLAPTSSVSKSSRRGLGKKRAQSLVPGEAARHMAPRKSILKPSPAPEPIPLQQTDKENGSGQPRPPLQDTPSDEEGDPLDNTMAHYTQEISDNTSRKSLNRRVSFAPLANYRLFESNDNTNSSGAPSSSPIASPGEAQQSPPSVPPLPPFKLSNENDYPGRRTSVASYRRSSIASEYGERSMSLDMDQESDEISEPPTDPVFFHEAANEGSELGPPPTEEDFEEATEESDGDEDGDMEITEAIALNINRKHSLSIAQQNAMARRSSLSSLGGHRRSSVKFAPAAGSDGAPNEEGESGEEDGEDLTTNSEAPMEFTIALGAPLKEPKPPSEAFLKLQALVNGGRTETEDADEGVGDTTEDMELASAVSRLTKARSSLGFVQEEDASGEINEASFTNTESSMDESVDMSGDRTVNVTNILGRVSDLNISGDLSERDATGNVEDEDFARPIPISTIAPLKDQRKENAPPPNVFSASGVFSAPGPARQSSVNPPTGAVPRRSQSPVRPPLQTKPSLSSSVFSAPPPTPSRIPVPTGSPFKFQGSAAAAAAVPEAASPKKRPAPVYDGDSDMAPPPAKKRLLENSSVANRPTPSPSPAPPNPDLAKSTGERDPTAAVSAAPRASMGGMRRPSGYFAQRRSLAPGAANQLGASKSPSPSPAPDSENSQSRRASIAAPPSREQTQVHDEKAMMSMSLSRLPSSGSTDKFSTPTPVFTSNPVVQPPTFLITPDEAEEDDMELESMDMGRGAEMEERMQRPQRKSLVSAEVPPIDDEFDDDIPSVSIKEFFLMTGVKFHDYTIPRRSTIHPSQLQGNRRESSVPPTMADYLTAMVVHVPQLELYRLITKDLQTFIDNSMRIYREAEDEVGKLTPILFREFSQANEEGREELMHQLKLIKANRLIAAKERWYDFRSRWVQGLQENADRGLAKLEKDRDTLDGIINQAQDLLPTLRQQHEQILLQLERERKDIEEIENSDPGYIEELKITIDEQNQLLDVYRSDVAEGNAKQERLESKLAELEAQRLENAQAIEAAERKITLNKSSTRAEVFRLKDELEYLQVLHSWRVSRVTQQALELVFNEQFVVTMPCRKFRPVVADIKISCLGGSEESKRRKKRIDPFPLFSELVVSQGEAFARNLSTTSIKRVVEELGDFWTSCAQIRTQFTFLAIKYPLTLELLYAQDGDRRCTGFKAVVSILLHKHKAKVLVTFEFSQEVLARWPFAIPKLRCEVKTAYGQIAAEEVHSAVMERLGQASVEDNHACLLDACVEAASRFD